ncbi:MAG TPA: response regulator transcription factor [Polyangiaceae bacterium]|nr:response regulator transcription factor [Polyangiaceae bacterium]
MTRPLVLVVEDDAVMRRVLTVALRSNGYDVKTAATGQAALHEVESHTPDVVLLDLGLPDIDGFAVTAGIRRAHELPIIVLSARDEEQQQIRALDDGANDYVTKPFREGELMARIRAALRRPVAVSERRDIRCGDLHLDVTQRRLFVRDVSVALTTTEFKLLHLLAQEPDRVVTHQRLLKAVWGTGYTHELQYLRVYMRQLRQKIEEDPSRPRRLLTALGVGYRLVPVSYAK